MTGMRMTVAGRAVDSDQNVVPRHNTKYPAFRTLERSLFLDPHGDVLLGGTPEHTGGRSGPRNHSRHALC